MEAVTTADTVEEARWTPRAIMPRAHATEGTAIAIGNPRDIATLTSGREQPSGPASGRQWVQNRGVAHAPAPSVTLAKCVSCAAQNAALVVPRLSLQVVGVERLAKAAIAVTGLSGIGFD